MNIKKQNGFTLIELLVVIAVIGILASVVMASLNSARGKARDAKRVSDMQQMRTALELYYADNGSYPGIAHYVQGTTGQTCSVLPGWEARTWSTLFDSSFTSQYISQLPSDPRSPDPTYCYIYTSMNSTNTQLFCTRKDGTVIDVDGVNDAGVTTGPAYGYVLQFRAESDLSAIYPVSNNTAGGGVHYCFLGQPR